MFIPEIHGSIPTNHLSGFLENLRAADADLARELANLLHHDRVAGFGKRLTLERKNRGER